MPIHFFIIFLLFIVDVNYVEDEDSEMVDDTFESEAMQLTCFM